MCIEPFGYHDSDCSPASELLDENIKGIELEIRSDSYYGEALEDLIQDNHLICEYNYDEMKHRGNMFLEDDGSVQYEIILQADTNKENLKMIKTLNDYGLNPYNIQNDVGTSCHVHLNRRYLGTRGLNDYDIKKAGEFMSEVLFEISGRTLRDYNSWAKSSLNCDIHADMVQKAKEIDNRDIRSEERYQIINCRPYNTVEFRIFSNYFNFDAKIIEMYMDMADHIIDIAEMMQNKSYIDNVDEIVEWTKDWFTKNNTRKNFYQNKCLESVLLTTDNIMNKNKIKIEHLLNSFKTTSFDDKLEEEKEFFRLLRSLDGLYDIQYDTNVNLGNINYENIINNIERTL